MFTKNGKTDDDKVYGDYVSIWHADPDGKLKLADRCCHTTSEAEQEATIDFKEPNASRNQQ